MSFFDSPEVKLLVGLVVALGLILGVGVYMSNKYQRERREYLEAMGCQLKKETETGRRVRSGKITRPEMMQLYECAEGDRVEIDGKYIGGAK